MRVAEGIFSATIATDTGCFRVCAMRVEVVMADQVQQIKNAVDIVQIIGERIPLQRAGKNFRGLSPFRSEKTPSFFVSPDIQRYKDFGGGASGDVITFLMEFDGITFAEALQYLADRAGIILEKKGFTSDDSHRERVRAALDLAAEYYHFLLTQHPRGANALAYVRERGLKDETIKLFKMGCALDEWDGLQKYLIGKKKFTAKELEDAGLSARGQSGKTYDRFRGRLMFPLTDAQGRVVGFSGRLLSKDAKEAKYINSPETMLYRKSELLFGFSTLKQNIRKAEEVYIVEGEFDVLSSYQAGVRNVVAIKGSACTTEHIRTISRVVKRMIFALDADAAGVEATKRAIAVAKDFDVSLRVLPLTGGKDPDEISRENPGVWRDLAEQTVSVYEFLLDAAFRAKDLSSGEGVRLATQAVLPILASIQNGVEQVHYINKVAKRLQVRAEVLEEELRKFVRKAGLPAGKTSGPSGRPEDTQEKQEQPKASPLLQAEKYLTGLLLSGSASERAEWLKQMGTASLTHSALQAIVARLAQSDPAFTLGEFVAALPAELQPLASETYLQASEWEDPQERVKEWQNVFARWQQWHRSHRLKELADALQELDAKETLSEVEQTHYSTLQRELQAIQTSS